MLSSKAIKLCVYMKGNSMKLQKMNLYKTPKSIDEIIDVVERSSTPSDAAIVLGLTWNFACFMQEQQGNMSVDTATTWEDVK
jgi:hypothetical protein